MECSCIRQTELPHTTGLFADYVYHFDRVQRFYRHSPSEIHKAAAEIRMPPAHREALVAALRAQNGDSESLRLLARPGTVAVVTGQQVGLFSGPAYTVYKALTAVKLARRLTGNGLPAVPVFWLATEDHDLAEVNHSFVFDAAHLPVQLSVDGEMMAGGPVGEVAPQSYPVDALRATLAGLPFGTEVADLVAGCYRPGVTLGAAFDELLKRLLPAYGLLHIDPMLPAVRELAAPVISSVLQRAPELSAQILERNAALIDAGYHAQVHFEDHTSLVFLLEDGRRRTLKRSGREYLANGRRFSTQDLIGRAAHLSPNALLRPVVQDAILPTAAYVGGAAELAYLAQAEVIYSSMLGRMPGVLPRSGFTLFDRRSHKLMTRYGITLADFFAAEDLVRDRIAACLVPPAVATEIEHTKTATDATLDRLAAALAGFDSTLVAALSNSRRRIDHQLSKMEHKIRRESLRRDERAERDAAYLTGLVYPHKHLQERIYSIVPFLARHGLDLIDSLYENIELDCPDHRLLTI